MSLKIRKNDTVIVITGKDKGKKGIVKKVISAKKVIISGINILKKHQKPVPAQNKLGGILNKEAPIDISNVKIFNIATGKSDKVGFKFYKGRKVRFFKSNGAFIS